MQLSLALFETAVLHLRLLKTVLGRDDMIRTAGKRF